MDPVLVDSNVLLDVATNDPVWGDWSGRALERAADEAILVINSASPVVSAATATAALDGDPRGAMLASKGRVPMTMPTHPVDRRLWFVSLVLIVAIVAVGIIVNRDSPSHVASPVVVRLAAAVIVTACAAVAKFVAGPRAAAATGVIGTLIAVVLLIQLG